jgi:hypothetical protein
LKRDNLAPSWVLARIETAEEKTIISATENGRMKSRLPWTEKEEPTLVVVRIDTEEARCKKL